MFSGTVPKCWSGHRESPPVVAPLDCSA